MVLGASGEVPGDSGIFRGRGVPGVPGGSGFYRHPL